MCTYVWEWEWELGGHTRARAHARVSLWDRSSLLSQPHSAEIISFMKKPQKKPLPSAVPGKGDHDQLLIPVLLAFPIGLRIPSSSVAPPTKLSLIILFLINGTQPPSHILTLNPKLTKLSSLSICGHGCVWEDF